MKLSKYLVDKQTPNLNLQNKLLATQKEKTMRF